MTHRVVFGLVAIACVTGSGCSETVTQTETTVSFTDEEVRTCLDERGISGPPEEVRYLEDVVIGCYNHGIITGTVESP